MTQRFWPDCHPSLLNWEFIYGDSGVGISQVEFNLYKTLTLSKFAVPNRQFERDYTYQILSSVCVLEVILYSGTILIGRVRVSMSGLGVFASVYAYISGAYYLRIVKM